MPERVLVRDLDVLLTMDPTRGGGALGRLERAAVLFVESKIAWIGPTAQAPSAGVVLDGSGCVGMPGLVDCHTHAVWAGSRADEYRRRLAGESYTSILEGGGGILSTVRATRAASVEELARTAAARLARMRAGGVTTVEVKSGYGLEAAAEVRMLDAAARAGVRAGVRVVRTFLGAHAVPPGVAREAYVRSVIEEQLPRVAGRAEAIDAYIDRGAFTLEEGRAILEAGRRAGLDVRVHAEQVAHTGAAELAADLGALSADHLERIDDAGIAAMARAGTVAVLLPAAMLSLRDVAPPVEKLRAAGVRMAVATDLNPGTSPVLDLWLCASLACVAMGLTVEEALLGVTANAAVAVGRPDLGALRVGAPGDLAVMEPPPGEPASEAALVQYFGGHRARYVLRDGTLLADA